MDVHGLPHRAPLNLACFFAPLAIPSVGRSDGDLRACKAHLLVVSQQIRIHFFGGLKIIAIRAELFTANDRNAFFRPPFIKTVVLRVYKAFRIINIVAVAYAVVAELHPHARVNGNFRRCHKILISKSIEIGVRFFLEYFFGYGIGECPVAV